MCPSLAQGEREREDIWTVGREAEREGAWQMLAARDVMGLKCPFINRLQAPGN